MIIYRGFEMEQSQDGSFQWKDETGVTYTGFATDDKAMDAIDAHKRAERAKQEKDA